MRISDWSSDVCSSDLRAARRLRLVSTATVTPPAGVVDPNPGNNSSTARLVVVQQNDGAGCNAGNEGVSCAEHATRPPAGAANKEPDAGARSEEHTSELQSLMRISYAVFCLTQKKKTP